MKSSMAQILQLSEYRRPQKQSLRSDGLPPEGPQYFCLRCDGNEFRLFATGKVQCCRCGAMIRNVTVAETSGQRGNTS